MLSLDQINSLYSEVEVLSLDQINSLYPEVEVSLDVKEVMTCVLEFITSHRQHTQSSHAHLSHRDKLEFGAAQHFSCNNKTRCHRRQRDQSRWSVG